MAEKKAAAAAAKKIIVRQTRSFIGRNPEVRGTLRALGLKGVGDTRAHNATPAVLGMIRRVHSIVEVTPA